jgi:hypothetical protein
MSSTLFEVGALTTNLTKHLQCGHTRTDFSPAKAGESMHCTTCRTLSDVVDVSFPPGSRVTKWNKERLKLAGYTAREIKRMELHR